MKTLLTLAMASGLLALGAPEAQAQAQTIEVNRAPVDNGWYPERSRIVAEKELKGAPENGGLRYPSSQVKTVTIQPGALQADGVRVTRSGSTRIEQPVVRTQARPVTPQPLTRYGTVVVQDPDAFRPARRD